MGVEYRLHRIDDGQSYYIGKPAHRAPLEGAFGVFRKIADYAGMIETMHPSTAALDSIGAVDRRYVVFRMSERWTVETLAPVLNIALLETDDPEHADILARDMLRWAGDARVVLVPDTIDGDLGDRYGFDPDAARETGSVVGARA